MSRRLRMPRSDESGFTLVELLVAMSVGLVVLMAAFTLLDRATSVSKEIADRQDALQRGRQAMETVVRQLRSQVCLGDETEPITIGKDDSVTFFADLSDGSQAVQQRSLRYDVDSKTLYEDVYVGTGAYLEPEFDSPPTTRALVQNVEPIVDGSQTRPMLRYYGFATGGAPGDLVRLSAPLTPEDAIRTVMVKIGFVVLPDGPGPHDRDATTLESDVYVRLADPSTPSEGPRCI